VWFGHGVFFADHFKVRCFRELIDTAEKASFLFLALVRRGRRNGLIFRKPLSLSKNGAAF